MNTHWRSWLCSPALKQNIDQKAVETDADIIHLDLEDSVPLELKDRARQALKDYMSRTYDRKLALRINSLGTKEGITDLLCLVANKIMPDILIMPKVESPREVGIVQEIVQESGQATHIFAIIETLKGLKALDAIAQSGGMLKGMILGCADMSSELAITVNNRGRALNYIKCEIALAAATNGVLAIDSPCFHLTDSAALGEELAIAKELAFTGKIAIHPSQVKLINQYFSPSKGELEAAAQMLNTDSNPTSAIAKVNGKMIGPPFMKLAKRILQKAEASN